MQITCDHNLVIRHVCVGFAGSCHDAKVWDSSTIKEWAENLPPVYYILGDLAHLLTPLRNITSFNLDSMQERYNYVHSSLRMSVECCIGVLKGRFRRLRYSQPLSNGKIVSANNDILASTSFTTSAVLMAKTRGKILGCANDMHRSARHGAI